MNLASTPSPSWPAGAWLEAGDGHRIWWCEGGDAAGWPVLIVHGGPGGASRTETTRWFDGLPVRWIVFDQRGCGRSTPLGSTVANDLAALVADAERLREQLGIERWALVGGSWGARVALAYASAHTAHTAGLFLRSPFLGSPAEAARYVADWDDWLGDPGRHWLGAARVSAFQALFHAGARQDVPIGADAALCRAWSAYDDAQGVAGGVKGSGARFSPERLPTLTGALLASWEVHAHYAATRWRGTQAAAQPWSIESVAPRSLADLGPLALVWGEADATCDPQVARALATRWPTAVACPAAGAGHRMSDPHLAPVLREQAQRWARRLAALEALRRGV